MSWHCLFCGNPEHWMRGKEQPSISTMVELKYYSACKKKPLNSWVCHADCLRKVLMAGQKKYLENGMIEEFEDLKKESKNDYLRGGL